MLKCDHITLSAGAKQLFSSEMIELNSGMYALVGRNGAGKTTFLNAILGIHSIEKGKLLLDNESVYDIHPQDLAKKVSLVRSRPELFGDHKVRDILLLGRLPYQNLFAKVTARDNEIVKEIADFVGVSVFMDQPYYSLSDGEKQMVLVARALIQDTPIVLLDEPSAFLDIVNRKELLEHLRKLATEKDKLIIFSTHHLDELAEYCDGVLLINEKKMQLLNEPLKFKEQILSGFGLK